VAQGICSVDGCDGPTVGRDLCRKHYQRWWKHGDPLYEKSRSHPDVSKALCSELGCSDPVIGRGWCSTHYQRWRIHGTPDDPRPTAEQRLLARRTISPSGCWLWTGKRNRPGEGGYGVIFAEGRGVYVHRLAHELWIGPIPEGYEVDHVAERGCESTLCFNPAHLEAVLPYTNNMRSRSRAALNARKTECNHGHPFDEANTWTNGKGRQCRACAREHQARRRAGLNADT
jgi:hypothetical protein